MLVLAHHETNKWGQRVLSSDYLSKLSQLPHNRRKYSFGTFLAVLVVSINTVLRCAL